MPILYKDGQGNFRMKVLVDNVLQDRSAVLVGLLFRPVLLEGERLIDYPGGSCEIVTTPPVVTSVEEYKSLRPGRYVIGGEAAAHMAEQMAKNLLRENKK